MKKFLALSFIICQTSVSALTLNEMTTYRPMQNRMSNTDKVESYQSPIRENQTSAKTTSKQEEKVAKKQAPTYADLSLKRIADDVSYELDMDSDKINYDLSVLWAAAANNSETIKYTIYKLSNPDEDKPNDSTIKKIIKPIANFSSVIGASFAGDPYLATSALIGGGLLGAVMKDDKEYNYNFSKVSDTDMAILIRKIDELQKKLLDLYIDYKTKQQLYMLSEENLKKREEIYKKSQHKSKEELIIADVSLRNSKAKAQRAHDDYVTSRAILENLVGLDTLQKIEQEEEK
ncbi:hypothetical protein IJ670_01650 [bacterium]|nr:hypothetical protein [bacterium]